MIFGRAIEQADTEVGEALLVAIIAAASALSPDSLNETRAGGFPSGVPKKLLVRRSAQRLLDTTEISRFPRSAARRALAWSQVLGQAQGSVVTESMPRGELFAAIDNCSRGLKELGSQGDPVDRAIVLLQLARLYRRTKQDSKAIEILRREVGAFQDGSAVQVRDDAEFLPEYLVQRVQYKRVEILFNAHKSMGEVDTATRLIRDARDISERYAAQLSRDFTHTWVWEGVVHRSRRDVRQMLRMEAETKVNAERFADSGGARRVHLAMRSANAGSLQDYSRATEFRYMRMADRLRDDLGVDLSAIDQPSIGELIECVERYRALGSKAGITALGNTLWDIATAYVMSGATARDPEIRGYVKDIYDVIEACWDGFATNGNFSLLYGRARLALRSGDSPTEAHMRDLLEANRGAYAPATALNALMTAIRVGIPGHREARIRLDELIDAVDPSIDYVRYARMVGLSAEWRWRAAVATGDGWPAAEVDALRATELLRLVDGVSINPEAEATAWMAAAQAMDAAPNTDRPEQLRRLLRAVRCVSELLLTIATTNDRRRVAEKFAPLFGQAATTAVEMGDSTAADLIMEAARRDRVGLLLAELARNPAIDADIRASALAMQDAGSATPASTSSTDDDSDTEDGSEAGARHRSTAILIDRTAAVKNAESVLGPLSALADPGHLDMANTATVLHRRGPAAVPTVVLQLLPLPSTRVGASQASTRVLRRLTIAVPGMPVQEFSDLVAVPSLYLHLRFVPDRDDRLFTWRTNYTPDLLPQPLRDLLADTPVEHPVRLMIVPTGFFHVPFDALPVTDNTHVLDHALVSIHGSLTGILSLMKLDERRVLTPSLAVYDGDLTHARPELEALLSSLNEVREIHSAEELGIEMGIAGEQPHSLLAMAVHGSAASDGWGQAKQLRDLEGNHTWVTAAQALSWSVPRLCVLASCNTPISTPDGIELGGFPLALMLRGATTVVGGLYAIDDLATSRIMVQFWRHLADGESALEALRNAKIDYLRSRPDDRQVWPEHWAGLVVYGAPGT
ncbi:CHAT domain-containing protein [Rhodococcus qingshengii]|uniref:CHAT domain-containing protein n=1 Tax=Rhodococcus qingshengii TaxID=334542 RepID=UPI0022B366C5|nr:CHAT domain-containing protein [Rhodococcus qingshengii]MCZ4618522.1 CHAT domain-containing protein [Rhodococcus qingshengii]